MNFLIRKPVFLKHFQTKAAKGDVIHNTAAIDSVDPSNLHKNKVRLYHLNKILNSWSNTPALHWI